MAAEEVQHLLTQVGQAGLVVVAVALLLELVVLEILHLHLQAKEITAVQVIM